MSQTYYAILTEAGEAKLANATALNVPLQISKMAVGDGNGVLPTPIRTQVALVHENYRADLNSLSIDPLNASQIIAELVIPESTGGWWIREMALYDAAGVMIAVCNCPPSYKPQLAEGSGRTQVLRMVLIVSSTSAVELRIDPSVVLATRTYVDTKVLEELGRSDFKYSALVATTANITLSGTQTIDGVAVTAGARVLVKNQTQPSDNGLYVVSASGWSRTQDADISAEVTPGLLVHIEKGTANADSIWQLITDAPITLGTTGLTFEMVAGPTGIALGTYRSVTVDRYGRVVAGTNPTTLNGYGITDPVLMRGDGGIGGSAPFYDGSIDDLAAIPRGRFYARTATTGNKPSPFGLVDCIGREGDHVVVIWHEITGYKVTGRIWRRVGFVPANGWGDWEQLFSSQHNATQSQVNAGSDDATFVSPKKLRFGFAASLTTNGYLVFPTWLGGLIIQWGSASRPATTTPDVLVPVSFPLAFPNNCLSLVGSVVSSTTGDANQAVSTRAISLTGFTLIFDAMSTSYDGGATARWLAIGN